MVSVSFAGVGPQIQGLLGGADGYLSEPVEQPEVLMARTTALPHMREAERRCRVGTSGVREAINRTIE